MNKRKALEELANYIEQYLKSGFRFHVLFLEEMGELLKKASGSEKEIFTALIKQLIYVKDHGKLVHQINGNEIIKHQERDYYSLHLKGKCFNLRLILTFDDNSSPVFLCAFYERAGKRVSDYTQMKAILKNRYEEVIQEG